MTHIDRRGFLGRVSAGALGVAGGGALLNPGAARAQERDGSRMNFVFILIDDMGWTDVGCFGSDL